MHFKTSAITAAGLAAHQVAAFGGGFGNYGGWGSTDHYSTPDTTDNQCSSQQASGYDWSGLGQGSFSSYGSNSFSGWTCSNSFGKRDLLNKRSFQDKCITSNLDDEPSISCDGDKTMSLDKFQVSASQDVDIECSYSMPDGSSCSETHSCSAGGSTIQNSQCGGAKSVTFKPAGGSKGSGCSIGVHSIGFNCGGASSVPGYSATSPPAYSTSSSVSSPVSTSSSETVPAYSQSTSTSESVPAYSSSPPSVPAYRQSSTTTSTSESVPAYSSSSTTSESIPAYSSPSSSETAPTSTSTSESIPAYSPSTSSTSTSESIPAYSPSTSSSESAPVSESTTTSESIPAYGLSTSTSESLSSATSASIPAYTYSPSSSVSSPVTASVPSYGNSSIPAYPSSSSSVVSPVESVPAYSSPSSTEVSPTESVPAYSSSSSSEVSPTESVPAYSTPSSSVVSPVGSVPAYSTSTIYSTTVITSSSGGAPAVTQTIAVSTTVCPVTATESSTAAAVSPTGYGSQPQSPNVLPKCLNSWMYMTSCSGNSDYDCFCKDENFMNKVYGCISAWSSSSEDTGAASSYLMGICAKYVPQNPAIITGCPSTVTPAATYSYQPVPSSSSVASPVTTSAEAPPVYSQQTITLYSTQEVTITSCGPEVTNCPASKTLTSYAIGTTVSSAPVPPVYGSSSSTAAAVSPSAPEYSSSSSSEAPVSQSPPAYGSSSSSIDSPVSSSAPAYGSSSSSIAAPVSSAPITTAPSGGPETIPCTTLTYGTTTVTVPLVQITTYTVTHSGSTVTQPGLGYGSGSSSTAAAVPGYSSAPALAPYPTTSVTYGTVGTVGTTYLPSKTPSSSPIAYQGAGARVSGQGVVGLVLGAIAGLLVL